METSSYEPTPFTTSVSPTEYSQSRRQSEPAVAKVNRDADIAFHEKIEEHKQNQVYQTEDIKMAQFKADQLI